MKIKPFEKQTSDSNTTFVIRDPMKKIHMVKNKSLKKVHMGKN